LAGFLLERGSIRHAWSKEVLILVMITVGVSISIKGLSMVLWGKNAMTLPPFSGETPLVLAGAAIMPQSIWICGITLISVIGLHYFLRGTLTGKAMRAVAASRRTAALSGIPVDRMVLLSFTISGALGAVAGIILTPMTTTSYDVGVMLGLKGSRQPSWAATGPSRAASVEFSQVLESWAPAWFLRNTRTLSLF
jgi:branched-chain amino acid transport system permease protein